MEVPMPLQALRALKAIFTSNLGVKPTERILVFTDKPTAKEDMTPDDEVRRSELRELANLTAEVGRGLVKSMQFVEYPATGAHGKEPPAKVWEAAFGSKCIDALKKAGLLSKLIRKTIKTDDMVQVEKIIARHKRSAVDALVAMSNYSTSHTSFRSLLNRVCGTRYASMPLFDTEMLSGAMNVDWKQMARVSTALARIVNKGVAAHITTPDGTDITFVTKGRKALPDTGILTKPGSFGNLPAGEVYLAPLEGTAQGRLVVLWGPTRKLDSPITITIEDGWAVDVSGTEPYVRELEARLALRKENRNIAELGIGTNPSATRPNNILESEKILGTVHIALGDNSSFGGKVKAPFHQDFVFFQPTLVLTLRTGETYTVLNGGRMTEEILNP
jgi:aminopeptidase